ncbi:MAG: response regulator [Xanthomonadales bacterium PRO7]|nr:response regulator [Xanthomonadales bacterium PRO7]
MQHAFANTEAKLRILVVDDQPSTTMLVRAILEHAGHRVDVSLSGKGAKAAMAAAQYDLLLLDLNLPDIPALQLLRDWQGMALPLVLGMTSGVTPELLERAKSLRMRHILEKPITGANLLATLATAIGEARGWEIEPCEGAPIDVGLLEQMRANLGAALLRRFAEQALADAWHCIDQLKSVTGDDIGSWRERIKALDGVARSFGAHRLIHLIAAASLLPEDKLRDAASTLTQQCDSLLAEARVTLNAWLNTPVEDADRTARPPDPAHRQVEISERERDVLRLTAAGKTSSETATELGITVRAVTYHVTNLLLKLRVANKTQAVATAMSLGLLE